ncbi:hypothetical protein A2U01_0033989, partial [Trifolium medium]|nr:hypothetical protein [Trifolium medium]
MNASILIHMRLRSNLKEIITSGKAFRESESLTKVSLESSKKTLKSTRKRKRCSVSLSNLFLKKRSSKMVIYESSDDDLLDSEPIFSEPPPTSLQSSEEPFILPSPTNSVIDFISFSPNHDLFNELLNDFHPPTPIPLENLNPDLEHTQKDLNKDLQLDDEIQLDPDALSNTISSFQNFINNNSLEQETLPSMSSSTEPNSS